MKRKAEKQQAAGMPIVTISLLDIADERMLQLQSALSVRLQLEERDNSRDRHLQ
jgi:hypothetical protein